MMKGVSFAQLFPLFLLAGAAEASDLRGYWKSFLNAGFNRNIDSPAGEIEAGVDSAWSNRVRFRFLAEPAEDVGFEAAYDFAPVITLSRGGTTASSEGFSAFAVGSSPYRIIDFDARLAGGETSDFSVFHNVDRLGFRLSLPFADIDVGRQAVAFGSARVVNPADVLVPFSYGTLDQEERLGVDAIRVRVPLGMLSEVDAGVVLGEDAQWGRSAAFVRARSNWLSTDAIVTGAHFQGNTLAALEFQRPFFWDAGFWVEAAHIWLDGADPLGRDRYWRLSTGVDRSFEGGWFLYAEYHFNGAGSGDPTDYLLLASGAPFQEGGVYLFGEHYFLPGVQYEFTPLLNGGVQVFWNLSDSSLLVLPNISYNLSENLYAELGALGGTGAGAAIEPPAGLTTGSEFGAFPWIAYTSLRWYF